jgi:hypothetical protein
MLMPKTPVDKNDLVKPREDQIRYTGKFTNMEPVSKTQSMYQAADKHLRTGIGGPDAGHPFASFLFREIIHP